jgi:hypothetical protein
MVRQVEESHRKDGKKKPTDEWPPPLLNLLLVFENCLSAPGCWFAQICNLYLYIYIYIFLESKWYSPAAPLIWVY